MVTTFETAGTYKNGSGLTPPTLRMHGMRYYLLHVPPYIYIYIYSTSSNLYTPDSVSLTSLACQLTLVLYVYQPWIHINFLFVLESLGKTSDGWWIVLVVCEQVPCIFQFGSVCTYVHEKNM